MRKSELIPLYKIHMPAGIEQNVISVLHSDQLSGGPNVSIFEKLLGEYVDNQLVTSTSDASTSLTLCLFLAGVSPGDNVIMSPLVCLSTSSPVRNLFAHVRWCDVDPNTGNLDPDNLKSRIDVRTRAIVVYHWAGNPADLDPIHAIARNAGIPVIEDAGEALGAEYHGLKIGAAGSAFTVFSFYPNRHITTIEGGAIACACREDHERVRWLKRYGIHQPSFRDKDGEIDLASDIPVAGWNAYMDHIAATIGVAQMSHILGIVARHQANGLFFDRELDGVPGIRTIKRPQDSLSAYWAYTFLANNRDRLLKNLLQKNVQASKVHVRNDCYTAFGNQNETLPGVDSFSRTCLSVPCGWWVSDEDRSYIVESIVHSIT